MFTFFLIRKMLSNLKKRIARFSQKFNSSMFIHLYMSPTNRTENLVVNGSVQFCVVCRLKLAGLQTFMRNNLYQFK